MFGRFSPRQEITGGRKEKTPFLNFPFPSSGERDKRDRGSLTIYMTSDKRKFRPRYILELARGMRYEMTKPEQVLWKHIRNKKFCGLKFKRQYPIGRYIADFYCRELKLIIEIDGDIHDRQKEYDKNRDEYLSAGGYKTLRIKNEEINESIENVFEKIKHFI
jgi:very-short-patch-repair endonuclease